MKPALAALLVCAVSVRARTEPDLPRAVPQPDTDPWAEDAARDTPVQTDGGSGPGLTALVEGQLRLATQKALSDLSDYVREALTALRQEVQQVQALGQRWHDELDHAVATLRQEARRAQVLGAPCRSDPDCSALRADTVCGGEGRCVCGEGLQEVAGGACRPYPRPSEPCRRHADCQGATERSECSGNICVGCWEGYVSSNGSACRPPRLSEACTRSAQCEVLTKHSVCNESQCACEEHFWNDRNLACRRSPSILDGRNTTVTVAQEEYYGTFIGHFRNYAHDIAGAVYAASEDTIFIKGFTYDGNGPDAFFWIGETERPSPEGILLPYPDDGASGPAKVLQGYNNADIVLRLPAGRKVQEMKWLSIWCRRFTVNFGDVLIPDKLVTPEKVRIGRLSSLAHSVSSGNIEILNAKTFYIPNFHYDGGGPDAYFWVGNGSQPSPNGVKVPDERGSDDALRAYLGQDIEITLPGSLTVYDIDWLAVWCVQYRHNFGSVTLPQNLSNVPPYLGQALRQDQTHRAPAAGGVASQLTNCRTFVDNKLRVSWGADSRHVYIELSAEIDEDDWMGFGLSGDQSRPLMKGGDVVVALYDAEGGTYRAQDYVITEKAQCSGGQGVCVDEDIGGRNDAQVISGKRHNGVTTVTFKRPIDTGDSRADRPIPVNQRVQVIAAIGPLNSRNQANYHSRGWGAGVIDFGSVNDDRCSARGVSPVVEVLNSQPWPRRTVSDTTRFVARIGPTGGKRGYQAVTGIASWGIAWWINDQLIPELYVRRGETYTFTVEGGNDPSNPAEYHPLYITDDQEGGYANKDAAGRRQERVFAGVSRAAIGGDIPTAAGRSCKLKPRSGEDLADKVATFEEYAQTLRVECGPGSAASLVWTVQRDTPDTVYYQCYTHRNLGWKIHVLDPEESLTQRKQKDGSGAAARATLVPLLAAALAALLAGW